MYQWRTVYINFAGGGGGGREGESDTGGGGDKCPPCPLKYSPAMSVSIHNVSTNVSTTMSVSKVDWGYLGHGLTWDTPLLYTGEDGLQSQTW